MVPATHALEGLGRAYIQMLHGKYLSPTMLHSTDHSSVDVGIWFPTCVPWLRRGDIELRSGARARWLCTKHSSSRRSSIPEALRDLSSARNIWRTSGALFECHQGQIFRREGRAGDGECTDRAQGRAFARPRSPRNCRRNDSGDLEKHRASRHPYVTPLNRKTWIIHALGTSDPTVFDLMFRIGSQRIWEWLWNKRWQYRQKNDV